MLDSALVSSVVFYPRKTNIPINLPPHIKLLNFEILEDIKIGGLCFIQDMDLPTILMFHGNGEIAQDYIHLFQIFFECDVNLAVVDYRGYGFSSDKPFFSSLISDAVPIYQEFRNWMSNEGFRDSLFLMGRSLGSVCASEIGSQNPPDLKGIIFESAFASIYNLVTKLFGITGITPESLQEWSNDTRICKIEKPVLIIHGSKDNIIPFSEGKLIQQSLPDTTITRMVPIRGAGHNDLFSYTKEYQTPLREFIAKFA